MKTISRKELDNLSPSDRHLMQSNHETKCDSCDLLDPEYDVICFERGSENPLYGLGFAVKYDIRMLEHGKLNDRICYTKITTREQWDKKKQQTVRLFCTRSTNAKMNWS